MFQNPNSVYCIFQRPSSVQIVLNVLVNLTTTFYSGSDQSPTFCTVITCKMLILNIIKLRYTSVTWVFVQSFCFKEVESSFQLLFGFQFCHNQARPAPLCYPNPATKPPRLYRSRIMRIRVDYTYMNHSREGSVSDAFLLTVSFRSGAIVLLVQTRAF